MSAQLIALTSRPDGWRWSANAGDGERTIWHGPFPTEDAAKADARARTPSRPRRVFRDTNSFAG